jgi:hypothetical protein
MAVGAATGQAFGQTRGPVTASHSRSRVLDSLTRVVDAKNRAKGYGVEGDRRTLHQAVHGATHEEFDSLQKLLARAQQADHDVTVSFEHDRVVGGTLVRVGTEPDDSRPLSGREHSSGGRQDGHRESEQHPRLVKLFVKGPPPRGPQPKPPRQTREQKYDPPIYYGSIFAH